MDFAFDELNCSISVTTKHWTRAHKELWIRWFELFHFGDYSALDTCSYGLLHSLNRTAAIRWLLSTWNVLIWTFTFVDTNCSISVTTQRWTPAHIDFWIPWYKLLHFGDYSELDTCSYGLLLSLIRTAPFRWLLSTGHLLILTFDWLIRNTPFRWLLSPWHVLLWTFDFATSKEINYVLWRINWFTARMTSDVPWKK
jgi:hypothetical protein